jgi:predicted aldo/keto reductase-like oxidoreductase
MQPINNIMRAKLGFGFMRLPQHDGEFDVPLIENMVDKFLESGNTHFDTAYIYKGSEELLKKTLIDRYPRSSFQITTKLPIYLVNGGLSKETIF